MSILALIIAFLLNHSFKGLNQLRQKLWLPALVRGANHLFSEQLRCRHCLVFALSVLLPLGVVLSLDLLIRHHAGILADLVYTVLILTYCMGPRDLDQDVNALIRASENNPAPATEPATTTTAAFRPSQSLRQQAEVFIGEPLSSAPEAALEQLVQATWQQSLVRWFGVIFWFAVLGPVGALLFRLSQWLLQESCPLSEQQRLWAGALSRFLQWPAAQLMTLGMAMAADFDTVFSAWRHYHREQGHGFWQSDNGFMLAAGLEAVKGGHANRDGFADQLDGPLAQVKLTMDLIWRVLGVWLVALALVLLAGWLA